MILSLAHIAKSYKTVFKKTIELNLRWKKKKVITFLRGCSTSKAGNIINSWAYFSREEKNKIQLTYHLIHEFWEIIAIKIRTTVLLVSWDHKKDFLWWWNQYWPLSVEALPGLFFSSNNTERKKSETAVTKQFLLIAKLLFFFCSDTVWRYS